AAQLEHRCTQRVGLAGAAGLCAARCERIREGEFRQPLRRRRGDPRVECAGARKPAPATWRSARVGPRAQRRRACRRGLRCIPRNRALAMACHPALAGRDAGAARTRGRAGAPTADGVGEVKRPGAASAPPAFEEPDGADEPSAARALRAQALPLVALMAGLRDATPADPAALRRSLAAAVNRFEAGARVAGVDEASVAAASYVLCAWGDEQFGAAPWGAGGAGLLRQFHGEAGGGDKLLRLLTRLAEKPREHRALLELVHTCLSLGLRARSDVDTRDHESLRTRVHQALRQVAPVPALT